MTEKEKVILRGHALCPLDGRYGDVGQVLERFFSESALMKYRVEVECLWLEHLSGEVLGNYPELFDEKFIEQDFESIREGFNDDDFVRIKQIESRTNHDVKAVEYFIGEKLDEMGKGYFKPLVHIGCTSEDINSTAYAMMLKDAMEYVLIPKMQELVETLNEWASEYANVPMLAHTHGQPATPTTLGKEMAVFYNRLSYVVKDILQGKIRYFAKWSGATGNYSAISVAFPEEEWDREAAEFLENVCGVEINPITTQIEDHDWMCELFNAIRMFANILIDIDRDFWLYISMNYICQKAVDGEVGSSTMPHKVNPIQFENSESNCKIGNALLSMLSDKLSVSRLQRDLTDSSSLRNVGMALGYIYQAISQTIKGMSRSAPNVQKMSEDLENNWEVLAEPIQTMLRKYGVPDAYEELKKMTRGKRVTKEALHEFIKTLDMLSDEDKRTLLELTPATYTGYAQDLAEGC